MKDRESPERIMKERYSVTDDESSYKIATVETRGEKANECSPTTVERFPESRDGKKRERPFLTMAMQGQSLLQSLKLADTGEEKKLAVTAAVRSLNKKVETFCTDWKNRAILREKKTPEPYRNHARSYSANGDEQTWGSLAPDEEKVMELWSHKIMHPLH